MLQVLDLTIWLDLIAPFTCPNKIQSFFVVNVGVVFLSQNTEYVYRTYRLNGKHAKRLWRNVLWIWWVWQQGMETDHMDVTAPFEFLSCTGIPVVIKNTAVLQLDVMQLGLGWLFPQHDYMGWSSGPGTLGIWVRPLFLVNIE